MKIFKILTASEWKTFEKKGSFFGTQLDLKDGYIHLSTEGQVEYVVKKYYAGIRPIYIVEFAQEELIKGLTWEKASSGEEFPHLYDRPLKFDEVSSYTVLE